MSTIPARRAAKPSEECKEEFERLAVRWLAETAHVSSSTDLVAHSAFLAIVNLGPPAIPLLLRELEISPGHWHRALSRITGVNPIAPADRGNIAKIAETWLRWGKEQGYQW